MDFLLFSIKKTHQNIVDFDSKWSKSLTEHCLPLLREALSSSSAVDSTNISLVLRHFITYYDTLNRSANANNILYLLFPSWPNSLEMPILFLGDIHPFLLTNLIQSFMKREVQDTDFLGLSLDEDHSCKIATAWRDPSNELMKKVDEIERKMGPIVTDLLDRMREAQKRFLENWVSSYQSQEGKQRKTVMETTASVVEVDEAAKDSMQELVSIFMEANGLRKSVINDIVAATSSDQKALFFEGVCKLLAGFKNQDDQKSNPGDGSSSASTSK